MQQSHVPLIVDSFAGGGGASTGIEMALGRSPDIAINHNADALALHAANHPERGRGMSQNISSAVMQQRTEAHDSLDDFPTQPWGTRALCTHVLTGCHLKSKTVWEPTCNRGHMVDPLGEFFSTVWASDIRDYGLEGAFQYDFLMPFLPVVFQRQDVAPDWIIANPPFRLAEQFIARALEIATEGVAMIVRTSFLEGVGRYQNLYSKRPPSIVAQFSERVPMVKGRLTATGSTATSYCWLVWLKGVTSTKLVWIPPCRKKLERPEDYAAYREVAA